ncbi:DUF202 domain-containing protein [Streptomyces sp. LE64]|uniref:DUF202 domain-containing protein n=1 Tax=Streptomyces sp. LE64 TaxID=3448653 RepID=UPI004041C2D3
MTGAVRDPGLQPERTRLAWRRTTLTATVVVVLAMRSLAEGRAPGFRAAAAGLCVLAWLGFLAVAHRRLRQLTAGAPPPPLPPRWATATAWCAIVLAGCAGVVVG